MPNLPPHLSEAKPEEYAFILLQRTRVAKKRVRSFSDYKRFITPLNKYPAPTFMEQFNQAAQQGELA